MLVKNQFDLEPGVYVHYKVNPDGSENLYVVESLVTHIKKDGVWVELEDPLVCYRNLDAQYKELNGHKTWIQKGYQRTLSEFRGEVTNAKGIKLPRFKRA